MQTKDSISPPPHPAPYPRASKGMHVQARTPSMHLISPVSSQSKVVMKCYVATGGKCKCGSVASTTQEAGIRRHRATPGNICIASRRIWCMSLRMIHLPKRNFDSVAIDPCPIVIC
ncbi:hypothetical protein TRVL_06035 [Trypanosoma vivax]|uniref:Uncharacterized protein n=1 Tax=Trypanosoma vivax (strain Y486) TaxID=1055687 RepID=G0TR83_TRYVY|nr:hypothetical protein TRVL_06035 [Trypanosoma vivax]CCC46447.1 hypothetical protein, unlikely [Trypanosoma vivax Y486]